MRNIIDNNATIKATKAAVRQLKAVMKSDDKDGYFLRMSVDGGGCSGMKYKKDIENENLDTDSLRNFKEVRGKYLDVNMSQNLDWDTLRDKIKKNGMRNSNIMAIAPTATIANVSGVYPCTEPAYKNMYMKENLSGNFFGPFFVGLVCIK